MEKHVVLVLGQTGVGKSSLINGIKNEIVCFVPEEGELTSGTKEFAVQDLQKGNDLYQFIDTPGLLAVGKGEDDKYKNEIKKAASEYPQLKCILLLLNLQNPKLDSATIGMVQNYMNMFPVQYFWENVIIVYTNAFRYNSSSKEKIEKRRGTFEKNIREKEEFSAFRNFMHEKNINLPYKLPEIFVNSEKNLNDIDNPTKKEYEKLLNIIKPLPEMFVEIKNKDRKELIGEGSLIPQIRTFRKIQFKPKYGSIIESEEFLFKESDSTNLKYIRTIRDRYEFYKKVRCRKVKFYNVYETKVYKSEKGEEIKGNKNYVGEERA